MSPPAAISTRTIPNVPPPNVAVQGSVLTISGQKPGGPNHSVSMDLNSFLGNVNGAVSLGGTGVASNASGVAIKQLGKYRHALDVQLPDSNGHVSTSSVLLHSKVGTVSGQHKLLMAWKVPHSTAHAEASSTDEADARVQSQVNITSGNASLASVVTLNVDPKYNLTNPNRAWVQQNLGPSGSSDSSEWAEGAVEGGAEVGMECAVDAASGCTIL